MQQVLIIYFGKLKDNMDKNGVLIINEYQKGQVKHPIYGFGLLKNVEVFENQGIAKLKNRSVLNSSISPSQLPIAEVYDIYGNTYTLTGSTGRGDVYKNGDIIQANVDDGWDLAIYKDYLWIRHSSYLSCYGPLNNAPQLFNNIDTGYDTYSNGKLLVGQDDFLYTGNGNYIAKIDVTASGTPGTTPTLSVNKSALDLPNGQYVTTMVEFGTKIAIGTCGTPEYINRNNLPTARIYTWNRQLGTLGNPGLADLPVIFNESGINAIYQHANKLYVSAGTQGNIYVCDGTNYQRIQILSYTKNGYDYSSTVYSNALTISNKGNLLVGLSGVYANIVRTGVYEINLNDSKYPVEYLITSGMTTIPTINEGIAVKIGFINSKTFQTRNIGWSYSSTFGVDTSDSYAYNSFGGVIESPLFRVGDFYKKKTFEHIQFSFASPLVRGQQIRLSYRLNDNGDYIEIGTWGFNTLGGVISYADTCSISDAEFIQIKIELDQELTTDYGNNLNLIDCKLW